MSGIWHGGKGSARRRGSNLKQYSDGWDRIWGNNKDSEEEESKEEEESEEKSDSE